MSTTPNPHGHETAGEPEPEESGAGQSAGNGNDGPQRLGGRFFNGVAEGAGQTVGILLTGLLVTGLVAGLAAGGVIAETQNGPHQGGGAAVLCTA
ncbi:hypothetical protein OG249_37645 [Streptomyces microflavus]|uniref:hypothetical protein n=1 Tax=Streptomyces microflavus TaxID=1919 RepID=UPI0022505A35|nr:hypothetical protein [Streptomyces microflavus]MCX4657584.1 hypothetical protein [Streptomyces microflavus]